MLDEAADALDNAIRPLEAAGENGISFFHKIIDFFSEIW